MHQLLQRMFMIFDRSRRGEIINDTMRCLQHLRIDSDATDRSVV
jgi:hypothetical protein